MLFRLYQANKHMLNRKYLLPFWIYFKQKPIVNSINLRGHTKKKKNKYQCKQNQILPRFYLEKYFLNNSFLLITCTK